MWFLFLYETILTLHFSYAVESECFYSTPQWSGFLQKCGWICLWQSRADLGVWRQSWEIPPWQGTSKSSPGVLRASAVPSTGHLVLAQSLLDPVPLSPSTLPLLLKLRIDRVGPVWKGLLQQRLCFFYTGGFCFFPAYSHKFTTVYFVLAIDIISLNPHNIQWGKQYLLPHFMR